MTVMFRNIRVFTFEKYDLLESIQNESKMDVEVLLWLKIKQKAKLKCTFFQWLWHVIESLISCGKQFKIFPV